MGIKKIFYRTPFFSSLEALDKNCPVFSDGDTQILAGDISRNSISLADGFREKGFQDNDRIVLIVPPGKEFLEIFFASNLLKATIAIIDPEMGRDNFESKLKQFNPKWIFIDSRLLLLREHPIIRFFYLNFSKRPFYVSLPKTAKVVATGKRFPLVSKMFWLNKLYRKTESVSEFVPIPDHEFVVTYTSGTLAEPKGVVHTMNSLFESISQIKNILGNSADTKIGAYLPHFLLIGICSGHPVLLYNKEKSAEWKMGFFERNKITTLFGPPSDYLPLIQYCKSQNKKLPESLKLLILGSAPVHPTFLELLYGVAPEHTKILCLYGMTENLVLCGVDGKEKINSYERGDVVGKPFPGIKLSLANDGEILVDSPMLFSHYLHLQTRETPHPTGDLGYLTKDGTLVLTGRKKDMIIRRDTNIYPAIYEKTIKNIPGISDAVMLGVYSESKHDEEVYLVAETSKHSEEELLRLISNGKYSIDKEALPDKIVMMQIPRSGRQNKIDRKKLRELLAR